MMDWLSQLRQPIRSPRSYLPSLPSILSFLFFLWHILADFHDFFRNSSVLKRWFIFRHSWESQQVLFIHFSMIWHELFGRHMVTRSRCGWPFIRKMAGTSHETRHWENQKQWPPNNLKMTRLDVFNESQCCKPTKYWKIRSKWFVTGDAIYRGFQERWLIFSMIFNESQCCKPTKYWKIRSKWFVTGDAI